MSVRQPDFDPEELAELRAAVLMLARRTRQQRSIADVSPTEAAVLARVLRCGPVTPGDLARSEHVQPPSMTRTLERLEGKQLLRREASREDRRQVLVSVTDAGREFVERTRAVRTEWLAGQLAKLDPVARETLRQALPALVALAEQP